MTAQVPLSFFGPDFRDRSAKLDEIRHALEVQNFPQISQLRLFQTLDRGGFTKDSYIRKIYVGSNELLPCLSAFHERTAKFSPATYLGEVGFAAAAQDNPGVVSTYLNCITESCATVAEILLSAAYAIDPSADQSTAAKVTRGQDRSLYWHIPEWMGSPAGYSVVVAAARCIPSLVAKELHMAVPQYLPERPTVYCLDLAELAYLSPTANLIGHVGKDVVASSANFVAMRDAAIVADALVVQGLSVEALTEQGVAMFGLLDSILAERQNQSISSELKHPSLAIITSIPYAQLMDTLQRLVPTEATFIPQFIAKMAALSNHVVTGDEFRPVFEAAQ